MRIKIVTLSGQKTEISIKLDETVEQLRLSVAQRCQIGTDQVQLTFGEVVMTEDLQTVSSYGVGDGSTIHMVVKDRITINVHVSLPDGSTQSLVVEPSEQIAMLKEKLHEKIKFQVDCMDLFFEGRHIMEGRLSHHNVRDGAKLQLRMKNINIIVKKLDGKNLPMEVSQGQTVSELKESLYHKTGVVTSQQRLVFNGRELNSGRLVDYGVRSGSIINMVGRLRGG